MFSFVPLYKEFERRSGIVDIPRVITLHHTTVHSPDYVSKGENRESEPHCLFHYTLHGHGATWRNGKRFITNPGEGFFNIVNEKGSGYGYPEEEHEPWEFVVICFDGGNTRNVVTAALENQIIYSLKGLEESFCVILKQLLEEKNDEIFLTAFPKLISIINSGCIGISTLSQRFCIIAQKEYIQNPTISAIASELHVSREHLSRVYYADTHTTPTYYLEKLRFEKLCYLLLTEDSESKIADKMNFSSVAALTAFFKRHAGVTPRQFRKNRYFYT